MPYQIEATSASPELPVGEEADLRRLCAVILDFRSKYNSQVRRTGHNENCWYDYKDEDCSTDAPREIKLEG